MQYTTASNIIPVFCFLIMCNVLLRVFYNKLFNHKYDIINSILFQSFGFKTINFHTMKILALFYIEHERKP